MVEESCDVAVVGAGPAGSTAARVAAQNGARVLLLERKAQVGVPEQCGGYVAKAIRWHVDLDRGCIAQAVDHLHTFLPDGTCHQVEMPGYVLNRAALDRSLALSAVRAGARLLLRVAAVGYWEEGLVAQVEGRELRIQATVIIGADGPHSTVARWMGRAQPPLARAVQHQVVLRERLSAAEVHFSPAFKGGYAWLFPAGETARVGAAFTGDCQEGLASLRDFMAELEGRRKIWGSSLSFSAGFVPVGGPADTCRDNMLLVGDAASQTHPITGAGILNAIITGEMAGRAAARAALEKDASLLGEYEEEWREVLGAALERAREKRERLEERWDSPVGDLSQIIRESWIAFDDYYRR